MTAFTDVFRLLIKLFVDDGSLAVAIFVVVALAALLAVWMPDRAIVSGAELVFGCLGVLIGNVIRATRRYSDNN